MRLHDCKKKKTKIKRFSSKKTNCLWNIIKSKIVSSGMFNSKFKFYEDVEFRNRFLKKNKIGYLEIPLTDIQCIKIIQPKIKLY